MKRKDFDRILKDAGFQVVRDAGHTVWSNGPVHVAVPHGKQINRMVARRLLKEIGYSLPVPELNYVNKEIGA